MASRTCTRGRPGWIGTVGGIASMQLLDEDLFDSDFTPDEFRTRRACERMSVVKPSMRAPQPTHPSHTDAFVHHHPPDAASRLHLQVQQTGVPAGLDLCLARKQRSRSIAACGTQSHQQSSCAAAAKHESASSAPDRTRTIETSPAITGVAVATPPVRPPQRRSGSRVRGQPWRSGSRWLRLRCSHLKLMRNWMQ